MQQLANVLLTMRLFSMAGMTWAHKVFPRCRAQVAGGFPAPKHSWKQKQECVKLDFLWILEKTGCTQLFGHRSELCLTELPPKGQLWNTLLREFG